MADAVKFNYQMRFSKTGRARFIAHLDSLACLVRAVRRTGFDLAFTEGMRPKPILSLAMPLGVGVEGEDEICDFSLRQRAPLTELAKQLGRELPEGMMLKSVGPSYDRSKAAAKVERVSYRIELEEPEERYAPALDRYNNARELVLLRRRPKGDKEVDIKKYVETVRFDREGRGIEFDMLVTQEGTARPEEIVTALSDSLGRELKPRRIVRTAIVLREEQPPAPGRQGRRGRPGPRRRR